MTTFKSTCGTFAAPEMPRKDSLRTGPIPPHNRLIAMRWRHGVGEAATSSLSGTESNNGLLWQRSPDNPILKLLSNERSSSLSRRLNPVGPIMIGARVVILKYVDFKEV